MNSPAEDPRSIPGHAAGPFVLDAGSDLRGTLHLAGDARLEGLFDGVLTVAGRLEVASGATLRGRAAVGCLVVRGRVEADVHAGGDVAVQPGGSITGALTTDEPAVEPAASGVGPVPSPPDPDAAADRAGVLRRRRRSIAHATATR